MFLWSQRTGVQLRFIQPGKPIQNALVESFNGKFRDACLNRSVATLKTVTENAWVSRAHAATSSSLLMN